MTTHAMRLSDPWYDHVASGTKRYEGRRRTPAVDAIEVLPFDTFRNDLHALPLHHVCCVRSVRVPAHPDPRRSVHASLAG